MGAKDPIADLAAHERARRSLEARTEHIRRVRWTVRQEAMACEHFDHGEEAFWGDPPPGMTLSEWMDSPTERERRFELDPLDPAHHWPKANRDYSLSWVERWDRLVHAIRELEQLEPGTVRFVVDWHPKDPRHHAMHAVFCPLLRGGSARRAVAQLARVRAMLVPTAEEVKRNRVRKRLERFELAQYFNGLLSAFAPRWEPAPVREPEVSILHETPRAVLDILRRETEAGRGITAKELAAQVKRSEERIRVVIRELKALGHPIKNPRGGAGYTIDRSRE